MNKLVNIREATLHLSRLLKRAMWRGHNHRISRKTSCSVIRTLPVEISHAQRVHNLLISTSRAHRSYLVNLQHVKEVIPYTRDSFSLRLKDTAETKIPLSKSAAKELRELLGY